jgi:transposase
MEKSFNYVGIDISKLTFDIALPKGDSHEHHQFSNDTKGFRKLVKLLNPDLCCVMEASGPYYLKLAFYLLDCGIAVSVINPLVIRRYSQMRMLRAKTDKKDAVMIADYGKNQRPDLWEKEAAYVLELKQMQAYCEQLNKNRTSLIRQQQAFEVNPFPSKTVIKSSQKQVKEIEKQLASIEKDMLALIEKHHKKQYDQIKSIPGIGPKTTLALIVLSGGFAKFNTHKQLCSYVGLSPRIFESGTSVKGRARICKMGMSRIRAMLYVCAWSAKKINKACRELFNRLVEKGKSKKLALIAVANKLLKQAFAIAKSEKYYNENNLNFTCL